MDLIVKSAESISYSNKDIENLLDNDVNVISYPKLSECKSLGDILKGKSCAVILYMTKPNYGHWTALIRDTGGERCWEVFDSYGLFPDDELKFISDEFRLQSRQAKGYLTELLKRSLQENPNIPIYFNKYELQDKKTYDRGINTCGRWCALRCLLKRFNLKEFIALFLKQMMPPDMIITYLTILNK